MYEVHLCSSCWHVRKTVSLKMASNSSNEQLDLSESQSLSLILFFSTSESVCVKSRDHSSLFLYSASVWVITSFNDINVI